MIAREVFDQPGLRMTDCEGWLEIMSPSSGREVDKTSIARLVETYAFLRRLRLNGYGSTTFCIEAKERGAEPDECCCIGRVLKKESELPDIVLEVIHTQPLLLTSSASASASESRLLPELDLALLARLAADEDQQQALDELRAAIG